MKSYIIAFYIFFLQFYRIYILSIIVGNIVKKYFKIIMITV